MLSLGQKVFIVADRFEQKLPIGDYAFIIAYDRNADSAFEYVIRVPTLNKHFYVTSSDIELEAVLIQQEAMRIEKESLIDFALATGNKELFHRVLSGESYLGQEQVNEVQSREDFVKQVNLKAWI